MTQRDPRQRWDDLIVTTERETVPSEEFGTLKQTDAGRSGWAVGAVVVDDAHRILLVNNYWADGWTVPAGGVKPNESLAETVGREVKEEGGIDVTPVRPHAITASHTRNEETGETFETRFVFFETAAETTVIPDELGATDDEVSEARWFDRLPENVYNYSLTERVYRRCRRANSE